MEIDVKVYARYNCESEAQLTKSCLWTVKGVREKGCWYVSCQSFTFFFLHIMLTGSFFKKDQTRVPGSVLGRATPPPLKNFLGGLGKSQGEGMASIEYTSVIYVDTDQSRKVKG